MPRGGSPRDGLAGGETRDFNSHGAIKTNPISPGPDVPLHPLFPDRWQARSGGSPPKSLPRSGLPRGDLPRGGSQRGSSLCLELSPRRGVLARGGLPRGGSPRGGLPRGGSLSLSLSPLSLSLFIPFCFFNIYTYQSLPLSFSLYLNLSLRVSACASFGFQKGWRINIILSTCRARICRFALACSPRHASQDAQKCQRCARACGQS